MSNEEEPTTEELIHSVCTQCGWYLPFDLDEATSEEDRRTASMCTMHVHMIGMHPELDHTELVKIMSFDETQFETPRDCLMFLHGMLCGTGYGGLIGIAYKTGEELRNYVELQNGTFN